MIQKKICMLGSFSVGKTSLVRRYIDSLFSDKYHTTVGVKVDKKNVRIGETDVMMMLWDLAGEDEFCKINPSYLRGSAGYLLVVDGTRPATLEKAIEVQKKATVQLGDIPFIMVLNKCDLEDEWAISQSTVDNLIEQGWSVIKSSAKTGEKVEDMFHNLAEKMLAVTP